ncbi:hypothetical protein Afil01_31600 [Actinorhabdospora filicis]|uniref:Type I-E CRISPR-associated protein Cse1/CasA n=1 Tax=Actinorhabdospora filicis TaxID=1785913 RepID=A0A9W6W9U5_9ACTN|nr:type I-E CRISPR-associated protein Cse1/CasA [Actinorhabdospora filicis]GLZ78353.1 hypothetical protein Afil01_31600 [Actinorhabdospora filicis]
MNSPSFDLLTRPWLTPIGDHAPDPSGLIDFFKRAHSLTDIQWPFAPAASGLSRVLTVLTARVTGLDDPGRGFDDWAARRAVLLTKGHFDPETVEDYFERWKDRFDLFGARPFLQDPRLATQCEKTSGVNKLVPRRPSGNNQVLWDHNTDLDARPLDPVDALWGLLTLLFYGPSGRCTSRTVGGVANANSLGGPLRRTISYHSLAPTVFQSLVLSVPYPVVDPDGEDAAPWERDEPPDPAAAPPAPSGVAGVLTGRFQHAVLLSPSPDGPTVIDCRLTWAWRFPVPEVKDPYLVYLHNSKGEEYARFADADRDLWRDLDSLLLADVGHDHRRRPGVFEGLETGVPFDLLESLRVRSFGFDQDGQTRDSMYITATTPPQILQLMLSGDGAWRISRLRSEAERYASNLAAALRSAWTAVNDPSNGSGKPVRKELSSGAWPSRGLARYWPAAEQLFWQLLRDDLGGEDDPRPKFVRLALDAYDGVLDYPSVTPRMARAFALNRKRVFGISTQPTGGRS